MHTEDEAKKLWCPFARLSDDGMGSYNRRGPKADLYCIAAACAAWRWCTEPRREIATNRKCERCGGSGVVVVGSAETAGGEECPACVSGYEIDAELVGYCGLSGEPK